MSWLSDLFSRQEIPQSSLGREPEGYNSVRAAMMNKYFQQMLNPYGISGNGPPPTFQYKPYSPWGGGSGVGGGSNPVSGSMPQAAPNPMLGALMQPPQGTGASAPNPGNGQLQTAAHFDGAEYAGRSMGRESAPVHPPRPYALPKYGPSGGAMGALGRQLSGVTRNNRIGQLQANRTSMHPQTYDGCTNPVHYGGMVGGRPTSGMIDPGPQGWGSVGGPGGTTFTPNAPTGLQPMSQPSGSTPPPPPPPKNTGGNTGGPPPGGPPAGGNNNSGVMPGGNNNSGGGNSGSMENPGVSLPSPGVNLAQNNHNAMGVRNYGQPNSGAMPGPGGQNVGGFDGQVYDGRKDAAKAIHGHADLMKKVLPLLLMNRGSNQGMGGMGGPGMGGPSLGVGPMGGPAVGMGR